MILKVQEYDVHNMYFVCFDEQGNKHRVDLLVDKKIVDIPEQLCGKTVRVLSLTPYEEIAHGVEIMP